MLRSLVGGRPCCSCQIAITRAFSGRLEGSTGISSTSPARRFLSAASRVQQASKRRGWISRSDAQSLQQGGMIGTSSKLPSACPNDSYITDSPPSLEEIFMTHINTPQEPHEKDIDLSDGQTLAIEARGVEPETFRAWLEAARAADFAMALLTLQDVKPWPPFLIQYLISHVVLHQELEDATASLTQTLLSPTSRMATSEADKLLWELAWRILPPHTGEYRTPAESLPSTKAYHLLSGLTSLVLTLVRQRLGLAIDTAATEDDLQLGDCSTTEVVDRRATQATMLDVEPMLLQYIDMLESHLLWTRDERILNNVMRIRDFVHSLPDDESVGRLRYHIDTISVPGPRSGEGSNSAAFRERLQEYLNRAFAKRSGSLAIAESASSGDATQWQDLSVHSAPADLHPDDLASFFRLRKATSAEASANVQSGLMPTQETARFLYPRPLYTALMMSFTDRGEPRSSLAVWQALIHSGFRPAARDLQEVCRALIEAGQERKAIRMLRKWAVGDGGAVPIRIGTPDDVSNQQVFTGEFVNGRSRRIRVRADAHLFSTLMTSLNDAGYPQMAYELFSAMRPLYQCPPDDFALNSLLRIACYARAGNVDPRLGAEREGEYEDIDTRSARWAANKIKRSFWGSSLVPAPIMARRIFRRALFAQHPHLQKLRSPLEDAMEKGQLGWLMRSEMRAKRTEEWFETQWKSLTEWRSRDKGTDATLLPHQTGASLGLDSASFRQAGAVNFVAPVFHSYILLLDQLQSPRMGAYVRDSQRPDFLQDQQRKARLREMFNSTHPSDPSAEPGWEPWSDLDEVKQDEVLYVLSWMRTLDVRPLRKTLALILAYLDAFLPPAISFGESPAGPLHQWLADWLGEDNIPTEDEVVATFKQRFGEGRG